MSSEEKRYALLIDSDNVSAKYIDTIFDELADRGMVTVRRIYGDWARSVNGWNRATLLRNSIVPIQQFAYTQGKNATDSAMIIDAMDLLYTGNLDGFCLVSSDSDFTRLAERLREAGKEVVGMGENKTPEAFVKACTSFKMLDALIREDISQTADEKNVAKLPVEKIENSSNITSIKSIQKVIYDIIDGNADNNKLTHVGEIGSKLQARFSDFDVRNYGYSKLTTFINEAFGNFEVISQNRQSYVKIIDEVVPKRDIEDQIIQILKKLPQKTANMGLLNSTLKSENHNFSIKKYGYSKFSNFLRSFGCFKIEGDKLTLQ